MIITSYRLKGDRSVELQADDGTSHIFRTETDARAWMEQVGATLPSDEKEAEPPAAAPRKKARRK